MEDTDDMDSDSNEDDMPTNRQRCEEEEWTSSALWSKQTSQTSSVSPGDSTSVLKGRMQHLPKQKSKVVRVFMSSTFTDMHAERNLLITQVYPSLTTYCRETHGLEFQVVDMRWGVREEAALAHSASALCMREIKLCQEQSTGPTFVMLLGDRYGSRPLPTVIPEQEFLSILEHVPSSEQQLVNTWYVQDTNAIPPVHVLQNINKHTPDINSARKEWKIAEERLKTCLRDCVKKCLESGTMDEDQARKYFWSVTEEEIYHGLIQDPDPGAHCLAFIRNMDKVNLDHDKAWRFVDQNPDKSIDEEAQHLKQKLHRLVEEHLPQENIFRHSTNWSDAGGVNSTDNDDYLTSFAKIFETTMKRIIDKEAEKVLSVELPMASHKESEAFNKVFTETLEHGHQCVAKVERFHGREDILTKIQSYLQSDSCQPLVIYGESGCGKTSVLAKAAMQVPELFGNDEHLTVLLRFLGTTPDSSTAFSTLASLYHQLFACYRLNNPHTAIPFDPDIPQDFSDMKDLFHKFIQWLSNDVKTRTVIFLDSLDQLSAAGNAYQLKWLPTKLPSNIKIVLSTLPRAYSLLTTLRSKGLGLQRRQFVQVTDLEQTVTHEILTQWLNSRNRQLTTEQNRALVENLKGTVRALYLKLVFDTIIEWKSYDEVTTLGERINTCINQLFEELERKHGEVLVKHAFGFLSASKNGLTEREMEDLLSLDEEVLSDVFHFHVSPVRRLPSVLWSRIRSDVSEYIVDREADGVTVMAWYHRQFIEAARVRYFSDIPRNSRQNLRSVMIDYFSGKWAGDVQKPFVYTAHQMEKLNLTSADSSAKRYVAKQPTVFASRGGQKDIFNIRFNQRKITELIHNLFKREDRDEMLINELIIGDVEMLMGFVNHHHWLDVHGTLVDGIEDNDRSYSAVQRHLVHIALLMSYGSCRSNINMIGPSLQSRLLVYNHPVMPCIKRLMENIDSVGLRYCALVNPSMQMESPGGEMQYIVNNHQGSVTDVIDVASGDDEASIILSISQKLVAVDTGALGEVINDFRPLIPDDDIFKKVVFVSRVYNREQSSVPNICVGALSKHPWIYIFNLMQDSNETLGIIKLEEFTDNNDFIIHEIWATDDDELFVTTHYSREVFVFHQLLRGGKLQEKFISEEEVVCSSLRRGISPAVSSYSDLNNINASPNHLLLVHNESASLMEHTADASRSALKQVGALSLPQHGQMTAHTSAVEGSCVAAFEDGTLCVFTMQNVQDEQQVLSLKQYNLGLHKVHFIDAANVRRRGQSSGCVDDLILCTEAYLVLVQEFDLHGEFKYEVVAKVNKFYTAARLTHDSTRIIAYIDGTVDVFEVRPSDDVAKTKIRHQVSIDAHGKPITKLIMTWPDRRLFFMTASENGTIKTWDLSNNIPMPRKFRPKFDRTKEPIAGIETTPVTALTTDKHCRYLDHWDLITGRKIETCQLPPNLRLQSVALCRASGILVGIDQQGSLIAWKLCTSIWDLQTLRENGFNGIPSDDLTPMYVKREAVPAEGSIILLISRDEEIWVLTQADGHSSWQICNPSTGNIETVIAKLDMYVSGAFIVDKEHLLTVSHQDGTASILHRSSGVKGHYQLDELKLQHFMAKICTGLAFVTSGKVILWNMHENTKSQLPVPEASENQTVASEDGSVLAHSCKDTTTFLDASAGKVVGSYHRSCNVVNTLQLSSDGKYFLHLSNHRDLCLVRVPDQTLLAEYIMDEDISGLALSSNDCFVCLSTADRRLYVLMIADPDQPAHRERIRYVRNTVHKNYWKKWAAVAFSKMVKMLRDRNITNDNDLSLSDILSCVDVDLTTDDDVVSWSDAGSELDMDDGRESRLERQITPTLAPKQSPDSRVAKPEYTVLNLTTDASDCHDHAPKSDVYCSHMCTLQ